MSSEQKLVARAPANASTTANLSASTRLRLPNWSVKDPSIALNDTPHVLIGFKRITDPEHEHWMNKLAAWWTRTRDDIYPGGALCHAEIMLRINNEQYWRSSINKGTIYIDERTKKQIFKPGTVFVKPVQSMKDYTFLRLSLTREQQYQIFRFLVAQAGGSFNKSAYYVNFVFGPIFGTPKFDQELFETKKAWFCSELIAAALQSAGVLSDIKANAATPNALYRSLARLPFVNAGLHPKQ